MRGINPKKRLLWFCTVVLLIVSSLAQLHFASLGSYGSGAGAQTSVASLLKSKAKEHAVSFLVSPGSNFIKGVTDLTDPKWSSAFETPYEGPSMNLPFFTVLGYEDWKGNYTALPLRTNITYDVGKEEETDVHSPRWTLPNWWYHYTAHFSDASEANAAYGSSDGSVGFVFIDTYILSDKFRFQNFTKLHWDNLRDTVGAAVRIFDWVIVIGDKAIMSSGMSKGDLYLSDTLRPFLKEMKVDAYISGNDYDMEVIEDGPLLHINCGAGSSGKAITKKTDNSVIYVGTPGFCHHTLTKRYFMTDFVDGYSGASLGNYTKSRNVRDRSLLDRFHLYKALPAITYIPIPAGAAVGDRPGGGGRGPPSEDDLFVRVVGTLGLIIAMGLVALTTVVMGHRISNMSK